MNAMINKSPPWPFSSVPSSLSVFCDLGSQELIWKWKGWWQRSLALKCVWFEGQRSFLRKHQFPLDCEVLISCYDPKCAFTTPSETKRSIVSVLVRTHLTSRAVCCRRWWAMRLIVGLNKLVVLKSAAYFILLACSTSTSLNVLQDEMRVMRTPELFFHLDTIAGLQSKCFIPHIAPNCSYIKSHSLVFSTCEERWMRIDNMAVLGDEERGSAPAVSPQRTPPRDLCEPQCLNFLARGELPWVFGKAFGMLIVIWCWCFFRASTFLFDHHWWCAHFFWSCVSVMGC